MKTLIPLRSFSALSSGAVKITDANAPGIPEWAPQPTPENVRDFPVQPDRGDQSIREKLHERATAPYVSAISYHRWGINE